MKLILTIAAKKDQIEVEVGAFMIRMPDGAFCVPVPEFDDWLRTEDFDLAKAEALLKSIGPELVIEFPDNARRTFFEQWLKETKVKAAHGARTMWP